MRVMADAPPTAATRWRVRLIADIPADAQQDGGWREVVLAVDAPNCAAAIETAREVCLSAGARGTRDPMVEPA
jgi:hypothetical protein